VESSDPLRPCSRNAFLLHVRKLPRWFFKDTVARVDFLFLRCVINRMSTKFGSCFFRGRSPTSSLESRDAQE
jgi:hypothetical protein